MPMACLVVKVWYVIHMIFIFFYLYTLFSGNFKLLNSHILFLHVCGHVECRRDEHIMNFSKSVVAVIAKAVAS